MVKVTTASNAACRILQSVFTSLENRLARFDALTQQLQAAKSDAGQHVELNVGGTRFHTTVGTLCQEPSFLQGMFSGFVFVSYVLVYLHHLHHAMFL